MINKHCIVLLDHVQRERYDALVNRKISTPRYIDVELLRAIGMWDAMHTFSVIWGDVSMCNCNFLCMKSWCWKFFSSFTIDTAGEYHNGRCYIRFQLGNLTHEINLA